MLLTGWVVAALAGAIGGYAAVRAFAIERTSVKVEQERITALASWCEQLRDLLTAEHGIIGTIAATARTCPEPIRPEVERLATRLSRQNPNSAVRQFAAELDDPSGDLVASVLLLAMSRSSRTSEMLSELAGTIRERAAMRLRVEAERAGSAQRGPVHHRLQRGRHHRRADLRPRLRVPRRLRRRVGPVVLAFVIAASRSAAGGWRS